MRRTTSYLAAAVILCGAAAILVNNALTFPELRAPDGYGHFSYIWYMAKNGSVPLSDAGWSYFHPPLYYAFMASLWTALDHFDPVARLKVGTTFIALLALLHGVAGFRIVREYFPKDRLLPVLAMGLTLYLPVQLYSAGFLGNERLNAVLCTLSLLALLWTLQDANWRRCLVLGLCLGLAMLTKFSSAVVVAGALGTLGLRALVQREWREGARVISIVSLAMLCVCGWYYMRNVDLYGTPFKMSRDEFVVQRIETIQTKGKRGLLEYVLFDPVILYRPQWPRGIPLHGTLPPETQRSALRESVWTGIYANTWFDAVGGRVLPRVTADEGARRAGQLLLTLGIVPTLLILLGIWTAIQTLWRRGWNDTLAAMLTTFTALVGLLILGTRTVHIHTAVKATYLTPGTVVFSFWFALGVHRLLTWAPRLKGPLVALCILLCAVSSVTFTHEMFIGKKYFAATHTSRMWQNLYGVIHYAGGNRERARELFRTSDHRGWYLGTENLAAMQWEDGRLQEAEFLWRKAATLQPNHSLGTSPDRARFNRIRKAEYLNSIALSQFQRGDVSSAISTQEKAVRSDPSIAELQFNLGVLKLEYASRRGDDERAWRDTLCEQAARSLTLSSAIDSSLAADGAWLTAISHALRGNCIAGDKTFRRAPGDGGHGLPRFPQVIGDGDMHAAGLNRRLLIPLRSINLSLDRFQAYCPDA